MRFLPAILVLASCAAAPAHRAGQELILCGADEVFIVDPSDASRTTWSWRAKDRPELPDDLKGRFNSTDDCKPVRGGSQILITSSGGGVALVDRASGKALFHAFVQNAHSAEILPGNRLVVAGSYGEKGNRLALFDTAVSGVPLAVDAFHGAHGAVWEEETRQLWALGDSELRVYAIRNLEGPSPTFDVIKSFPLPGPGGHDLRAVPGTRRLSVTVNPGVWFFDRTRLLFEPHAPLGDLKGVKSVDVHPATGRIAYVQAETSWWAERVRFSNPDGELAFPGRRLYKARWLHQSP